MRKTGFLTALLALALSACGGGEDAFEGGGGGGATPGTQAVQLGRGAGATFQAGAIEISGTQPLSAGGSASLSVTLQQADGTLFTNQAVVTFNSPCVAAGTAQIQPNANVTTITGVATVTYVASGCAGSDVITATTTVNGVARTATGTITVAEAAIGSIVFVSATPTNIALRGTGEGSRPESSTLVFQVRDAANGPRVGATVSFALNTTTGGITLQPSSATAQSDAQGNVQIVVNAGTVPTSVRVTATVMNVTPSISTQSSLLTITTGLPTANSFSLAVGCYNVEGLEIDGITTSVTARLRDRYGNPVPDGTAVTFTTEGGGMGAQCTTSTNSNEGGVCAVTWNSSNPRPSNGRVSLLARAIGEESFVDLNGNGSLDATESFTDLSEPFRDDDESGSFTAGTDGYFYDFNTNGTRDPANGQFNGALCDGASCGAVSTGIGASNLIIMSGSTPLVSDVGSATTLASMSVQVNTAQQKVLWIRDVNGNPMPGGTTVSATFAGAGATLGQPSSFEVPCTVIPIAQMTNAAGISGVTRFGFTLAAGGAQGAGFLNVTITTPSGRATLYQIPVSITP